MKRPFAVFGGTLLLLIITAFCTNRTVFFAVLALSGVVAVLLLCAKKYYAAKTASIITAAALLGCLLFLSFYDCVYTPSLLLKDSYTDISGTFTSFSENEFGIRTAVIKNCTLNNKSTKLNIKLKSDKIPSDIKPGDTVNVKCANIETDISDGAFFVNSLSDNCWLCSYKFADISVTPAKSLTLADRIEIFRKRTENNINTAIPEDRCASVANALLSGSTQGLSNDFRTLLSVSGASHIFAVSGMHLSLWTGLILFVFTKNLKNSLLARLFTALFVILYTIFTGMSPSVIRSGVMLLSVIAGNVLRRKSDPLNSLGVAVTGMLIVNPCLAGNVSFLLSVFATAAIAGPLPSKIKNSLSLKRLSKNKIFETVLISLTVLLFTCPICAVFFGQLSLLSPVSSVLLTLPAEGVMLSAFLCAVLAGVPVLGRTFAILCSLFTGSVCYIVDLISDLNFAVCSINADKVFVWYIFGAVICIAAYYITRKNSKAIICTAMGFVTVLILYATVAATVQTDDVYVYFPNSSNTSPMCVVAENGEKSLLIGSNYINEDVCLIENFYQKHTVTETDFLIETTSAQEYSKDLFLQKAQPKTTYVSTNAASYSSLNNNTVKADKLNISLAKNVSILYEITPDYTVAVLIANGKKYVYCPCEDSNFSNADIAYLSGDRLFCCSTLPEGIDKNDFTEITFLNDTQNTSELSKNDITIRIRNGVEKCLL